MILEYNNARYGPAMLYFPLYMSENSSGVILISSLIIFLALRGFEWVNSSI